MSHEFVKTTWNNGASPAITAQQLNRIEDAIDESIGAINDLETGKQDELTFDSTPTANSQNPVTSGGIKQALDAKADLASPTFTGMPKVPTPAESATQQIANVDFVTGITGPIANRVSDVENYTNALENTVIPGIDESIGNLQDNINDLESAEDKLAKAISTNEETMTATKNYAVGDLVMVNNQLYRVTSPIASGSTITPSVNVITTTIDAELDTLETEVEDQIPAVDNTLAVAGAAADAKKTGDELTNLKSDLSKIVPGLSEEAKAALLDCFAHTTWDNGSGASYYIDKLRQALEATETLVRISVAVDDDAIFTTGTAVEDLRDYIVVTTIYNTGKSITVNDYSITGNALAHGENTITISYEGVENTITIVAYTARAALISDVASSIGYSNLSCNNGNFSADSLAKFSILQFNTAIKRMKFNTNNDRTGTLTSNVWYAIKKDGNDYYCATGEVSANLFSLNQDGTAYTASSVTGIDFVKEGNGIKDTSIKTFILDGDTLKIKGDNGSLTITPANCIGVWGQPGTMICPVNVVVYE